MAKVSFVAFSLTLVLSSQFVVGQNEKAIDEAASPEAVGFKSSVGDNSRSVDGTTFALADEVAASPEPEEEIATEVSNGLLKMEKEGLVDLGDVTSDPNFKEEVAKAIRYFKSNAKDNAITQKMRRISEGMTQQITINM
ncbi:hypothetical protein GOBAR_AA01424 [Gossypium barbadense]|uniref:Secreted RxLR effector peptide protein n=1 Tax=Gossypium barbadense TaxID=3634 RepID=A0A2P5YU67_GOSBA|nr:hypothetical protein GOBAR_AA01424 [Gossypium barbadense]